MTRPPHRSGSRSAFVSGDSIDPRFFDLARSGDPRLREQLILDNQGLAVAFAQRYRDRGVPLDDLRQIALAALVRAVDRFEPQRGLRFSTFAGRTIEGELKQYFRDRTWDVKVPRSVRQLAVTVRSAAESLTQQLGRTPTAADIAAELDLELDDVVLALDASSAARAEAVENQAELARSESDPFDHVDARVVVPQLLALLPETERAVVEQRFFRGLTQTEIAASIGVSQMQVSRLLRRALDRLRTTIETSP